MPRQSRHTRGAGWDVFDANGRLEIQRIDSPDNKTVSPWPSDAFASIWVWQMATNPHSIHKKPCRRAIREIVASWDDDE